MLNARFRDEIILPTLTASAETADSSELFLRSYRLLAGFALAGAPTTTSGIVDPDAPAADRGERRERGTSGRQSRDCGRRTGDRGGNLAAGCAIPR